MGKVLLQEQNIAKRNELQVSKLDCYFGKFSFHSNESKSEFAKTQQNFTFV